MKIIKKILKNIVYFFYNLSAVFIEKDNQAVVLMYHSIDDNDNFFTVKTNFFSKQMAYLVGQGYNVVPLKKLRDYLADGLIPPKTVAVTFDDGYEDNYLNAWPILKKYNLPAAVFVPVALVGKTVTARNGAKLSMLTYGQMDEMVKSGLVEIGSHGYNHKKLSGLSRAEIDYELSQSKKAFSSELNRATDYLAYPFGSLTETVKTATAKLYALAFTVKPGIIDCQTDRFALKRNSIDSRVSFYQFKHIVQYGRI